MRRELELLGHLDVKADGGRVSGSFRLVRYDTDYVAVCDIHSYAVFLWASTILSQLDADTDVMTCVRATGYRFEHGIVSSAFGSIAATDDGKKGALLAISNLEYQIADTLVQTKYAVARIYDRASTLIRGCLHAILPTWEASIESIGFFMSGVDVKISLLPRGKGKRRLVAVTLDSSAIINVDADAIIEELRKALIGTVAGELRKALTNARTRR
jgi:hypothetical protein